MAFLDISYSTNKRGKFMKYKHCSASSMWDDKKVKFSTGDFVKDWFDLWYYLISEGITDREPTTCSSSIDHFIMDGAPFRSAYLHIDDDGNGTLLYWDDKKHDICKDAYIFQNGIELFVNKGEEPTWEEMKARYKTKTETVK